MYIKTQKRVEIIECQNFDPNARRLTNLEPNVTFNDFAISREPFDELENNNKTDWNRLH